ncbi:MAG: UpxY family transcription antiterminator [Bacteroidales bacterium]|nr:UpxY family transcription antiterminator [Bacteroidales bacterium]
MTVRKPIDQYQWFALYTRSQSERKVAIELQHLGIEFFLPMISRWRQWSDRKKKVDEPLFRSYVFVFISEKEYFNALNVPGAVRFVTFGGKAVSIPENQIAAIRQYIKEPDEEEESELLLKEGELVKIKAGPMEGLIGKLLKYKNKFRLIIQIDTIGQSIALHIPRSRVEVLTK